MEKKSNRIENLNDEKLKRYSSNFVSVLIVAQCILPFFGGRQLERAERVRGTVVPHGCDHVGRLQTVDGMHEKLVGYVTRCATRRRYDTLEQTAHTVVDECCIVRVGGEQYVSVCPLDGERHRDERRDGK